VDLLGRLERCAGAPARGWRPEKGGSKTDWVEALAVDGEGLGRSRGGLTSKIHLAVDGRGRPMSILVTPGQAGDNPQLLPLLDQVSVRPAWGGRPRSRPRRVIADKAYSHPSTRRELRRRGIAFTCPERSDQITWRKAKGPAGGRPPGFDRQIYKKRNVVERCFGRLKQFRGLATRYAKRLAYYRTEVVIATIAIWLRDLQDGL
jgi:transposase